MTQNSNGIIQDEMASKAHVTLKYEGDFDGMDAFTLIQSMHGLLTITEEVNREINPDHRVNILVDSVTPGSFIIELAVASKSVIGAVKALFSSDALSVIKTVCEILNITQHLKGKEATKTDREGDRVLIQNCDGNTINVTYNAHNLYFDNGKVNNSIDKTFQALNQNTEITGLEIVHNNNTLTKIPRSDFEDMVTHNPAKLEPRIITQIAELKIVAVMFVDTRKWTFKYQGKTINASIQDPDFHEKVDKQEINFAKGDALEVELSITQEWDENIKAYIDVQYAIARVIEHHRGPGKQMELPDDPVE